MSQLYYYMTRRLQKIVEQIILYHILEQLNKVYRVVQSLLTSEKPKRIGWGFLRRNIVVNTLLFITI